jgi:adenylate kinase
MTIMNLVLLGPPGAGKGTQAVRLCEELQRSYIASGDLLRRHRAHGSALGQQAAEYMTTGKLVPDQLVIDMILDELGTDDTGFLLDGFPRTLAQADALTRALAARGRRLDAVVLVDAPDDIIAERICGRRQCPNGHVFHLRYNPPAREAVCDHDGEPLEQRDDDRLETVRERLSVYHKTTEPLIAHYEQLGLLVRVDGTLSPPEVSAQIQGALATLAAVGPNQPPRVAL